MCLSFGRAGSQAVTCLLLGKGGVHVIDRSDVTYLQQKLNKLRRLQRLLKILLIAAAHHVVTNERADIV